MVRGWVILGIRTSSKKGSQFGEATQAKCKEGIRPSAWGHLKPVAVIGSCLATGVSPSGFGIYLRHDGRLGLVESYAWYVPIHISVCFPIGEVIHLCGCTDKLYELDIVGVFIDYCILIVGMILLLVNCNECCSRVIILIALCVVVFLTVVK